MQTLQVLTDKALMESVFRLLLSALPKHRFYKSQRHENMEKKKDVCVCVCVCACVHRCMFERKRQMDTNGQRKKDGVISVMNNILKLG